MKKIGTTIISPSGNLYGSEQVLIEYLNATQKKCCVYVPDKSQLHSKLTTFRHKHSIRTFSKLYLLYSFMLFKLFFTKSNLYINEGGHIRYIKILARLLVFRNFFVHIRLLEDCTSQKMNKLPRNIQLITVSNFLRNKIHREDVRVIIDPYTLSTSRPTTINPSKNKVLKIGIIGRLTATKGLEELFPILDIFEKEKQISIKILFFGSYNCNDVWTKQFLLKIRKYTWVKHEFLGFVSDRNTIYSNINLVLHLNKVEALGRIIFEAVDYEIPILTFHAGGCGELLNKLGLSNFLISTKGTWAIEFHSKIVELSNSYPKNEILKAKEIINVGLNANQYVSNLEDIIC